MVKGIPFRPMQKHLAWKLARGFFKRAIKLNPNKWILHYSLAKCTWKMFSAEAELRETDQGLLPEDVTGEIIKAIELLPTKKDARRTQSEPILEPHYKLVSVVHKMVLKDDLEVLFVIHLLLGKHRLTHLPVARRSVPYTKSNTVCSQGRSCFGAIWLDRLHSESTQEPSDCRQVALASPHDSKGASIFLTDSFSASDMIVPDCYHCLWCWDRNVQLPGCQT